MSPAADPDLLRGRLAALRALITPGLYAADLENSPLLDHPAVLGRAGHGATDYARAQAFITVLEDTVDQRLRANDKVAARMLFALGEWSGRPVTERHRAVAKLRNRQWSWERNYRKQPLERDLTTILLALDRATTEPGGRDTQTQATPADHISTLSDELIRDLGRRRTAYPLDMSLHELNRAELFVEARVVRYHERGRHSLTLTLDSMMEALRQGRSVLLLGEPGAGKSVALYDLVQRGLQQGLAPIPMRARDHDEVVRRTEWPAVKLSADALLFVDSLDEAAADREELARDLREMLRLRPVLATSRLWEYEHEWAPLFADAGFDEVYVLLPWRVDVEFRDYLRRLNGANLIDEPTLIYDAVRAREHLSRLVRRPLYARMLTFVGEPAARGLTDPTALYGEYLTKLARVAESSAGVPQGALRVWQAAAWAAYSSGVLAGDAVVLDDLDDALPNDLTRHSSRRTLDLILDIRTVRNREVGEFLHYSFYEYLVAAYVGDALVALPDASSIHGLLRQDLTREIRHHLIAQLRIIPLRNLRETLVAAYKTARSKRPTSEAQAVCNLLVYLLSRTVPQSETALLELLDTEEDLFLSAAILWALCHRGAPGSDGRFFEWLHRDSSMRSLCRGYVLYYYGDMDRNDGPPYSDEPPFRPFSNTLRVIMDVFERSVSIEKVSALRRAIDLYTFLDILAVRNVALPGEAVERLQRFQESLPSDQVDARLWAHLAEMMNSLRSRQQAAISE